MPLEGIGRSPPPLHVTARRGPLRCPDEIPILGLHTGLAEIEGIELDSHLRVAHAIPLS